MCKCITEANKALAANHTAVTTTTMLVHKPGAKSMSMEQVLCIPTHSTKKGKRATVLKGNYCPLCGENQQAASGEGSAT